VQKDRVRRLQHGRHVAMHPSKTQMGEEDPRRRVKESAPGDVSTDAAGAPISALA
jgi:hypothetical protein